MSTEPRVRRSQAGFTLIEVLVAMVILSVGLLGLEALGIGAARAVTRASNQTRYTEVASGWLNRELATLRAGTAAPAVGTTTLALAAGDPGYGKGVRVTRIVAQLAAPRAYRVSIAVAPLQPTALRQADTLSSTLLW